VLSKLPIIIEDLHHQPVSIMGNYSAYHIALAEIGTKPLRDLFPRPRKDPFGSPFRVDEVSDEVGEAREPGGSEGRGTTDCSHDE